MYQRTRANLALTQLLTLYIARNDALGNTLPYTFTVPDIEPPSQQNYVG